MSKELGARLRLERDQKGLSQADLEEASGVLKNTISQIEHAKFKRLSLDKFVALLSALDSETLLKESYPVVSERDDKEDARWVSGRELLERYEALEWSTQVHTYPSSSGGESEGRKAKTEVLSSSHTDNPFAIIVAEILGDSRLTAQQKIALGNRIIEYVEQERDKILGEN